METTLAVVDDELFDLHLARDPSGARREHPERPERLVAARAALHAADGLTPLILAPRDASLDELHRVHEAAYLSALELQRGGRGQLDADTYFSEASVDAARRAAGGAIALVDALLDGQASFGLGLLRPPGHHARPSGAMGFCLLNNVAVAAAHAVARGAERVMILDWDVHHGNGTQEIFYADPRVLYASVHQAPFYPGTGACSEIGTEEGRGYTVNVPLSAGADGATYQEAVRQLFAPVLAEFDPDLLLISAGFDAHRLDPLANMDLTAEAYPAMLDALRSAWPRESRGRLALLLEGGYHLKGLETSLGATLNSLGHAPRLASAAGLIPNTTHQQELAQAREQTGQTWRV